MSVGLGTLGIVVPGLPTTPFLLLASWCYYRGSTRLQKWLLESRVLGAYIREYEEKKGMTVRAKIWAISVMCFMCTLSIFLFIPNPVVDIIVAISGIIGAFTVALWVPTAED